MKSLEIVNESIEYIEFILKNDGGMDNEQKEQFKISLKKSKQIKQDLEILEILKEYLYEHPKSNDNVKIISMKDIFILKQCKSEELLKLKQWLEVNGK